MKKNILIFTFLTAIIGGASITLYQNHKSQKLSGFTLQNLIALTDNEQGGNGNGNENNSGNSENISQGEANQYHYKDRSGEPKECTLYKYWKIGTIGEFITSESPDPECEASIDIEYKRVTITGIKDSCSKKGDGCNPFSCQEIAYVP